MLNATKTLFSFEFYPPKSKVEWDKLFLVISDLSHLKPAYVSVTYGAGGSTRERTYELVVSIQEQMGLPVVAHLTCIGSTRDEVCAILEQYAENGVNNILALRGDPPKGQTEWTGVENGFVYAADLVAFIKRHFPDMGIGVAGFPEGHPGTPNRLKEIEYLKAKVDAGADYIVTQLFFDNRDYYDFCERCELAGIKVPIVPGIMPITTYQGMIRIAELAAGARIPARLLKAVAQAESEDSVRKAGVHWAAEQVSDLIEKRVPGIHFYTLNRAQAILEIYETLGVMESLQLASLQLLAKQGEKNHGYRYGLWKDRQ
ncbi:MAG: methylenetetrahydrofolate reductase [NAD(P)H] [Proteobacteria bacterium]|nr:methylenetetrahydrofolate reductase [NAD(P)H] [Pseudomonadota bacterium]